MSDATYYSIGDAPVQPEVLDEMRDVGRAIDHIFNGPRESGEPRRIGFVLMTFEFGEATPGQRMNYLSNASRADVRRMLVDQLKQFDAQQDVGMTTHTP